MPNMPLGGLLKSFVGETQLPSEKSEPAMVAESLMMELEYQIQEAVQAEQERKTEEKRKATGVDYSWLMSPSTKSFEMPQVERMEIEEMCLKIKPTECGKVITMFRDSLLRNPPVHEIPRCLRAVVTQVLDTRPKEDTNTIPEWLTKSFTKLRPTSSRIMPINTVSQDVELQRASSSSFTVSTSPSIPDEISDDFVSYTSVEHLPVWGK